MRYIASPNSRSCRTSLLRRIYFFVQLWRLVFLEPAGVQGPNVPHFKGLICDYMELTAQGRDSTFTFRHALLKKAILHLKRANMPFFLSICVCMYWSSGLLNQSLLDGLADWAVQAGLNQINQFFAKYPHFSSSKFIFLTLKPQNRKNSLNH